MKIEATKRYTIKWSGTPQDYIRMANELSLRRGGDGLDSLDCGDATAVVVDWIDEPAVGGHKPTEFDSSFFSFEGDILIGSFRWEYPNLPAEQRNISITPEELQAMSGTEHELRLLHDETYEPPEAKLKDPETCSICLIEVEWDELTATDEAGNLCADCYMEIYPNGEG